MSNSHTVLPYSCLHLQSTICRHSIAARRNKAPCVMSLPVLTARPGSDAQVWLAASQQSGGRRGCLWAKFAGEQRAVLQHCCIPTQLLRPLAVKLPQLRGVHIHGTHTPADIPCILSGKSPCAAHSSLQDDISGRQRSDTKSVAKIRQFNQGLAAKMCCYCRCLLFCAQRVRMPLKKFCIRKKNCFTWWWRPHCRRGPCCQTGGATGTHPGSQTSHCSSLGAPQCVSLPAHSASFTCSASHPVYPIIHGVSFLALKCTLHTCTPHGKSKGCT